MNDKLSPNTHYEQIYWEHNELVAGIDEAGRGCLAGPVVASTVILKNDFLLKSGVNDSKVLKVEKREELFRIIIENAIDYGIGIVDNIEIDKINILQASFKAMHLAVGNLHIKPQHLLIDGNRFKEIGIPFTTIIDGDAICLSIAAASIIAKVTRDRIMSGEINIEYPEYNFNKHKGYGTKEHYRILDELGITPIHRLSFLKKYQNMKNTFFG